MSSDAASSAASGHTLFARGDVVGAAEAFANAARAAPSRAEYHMALADAETALGRWLYATRSYESALANSPRLGAAYYGLGRVALARDAPDDAVQWLQSATAMSVESGEAWLLLGAAQAQLAAGREVPLLWDAVDSLGRAVHLLPRSADAYWQLGDSYANSGRRRLGLYCFATAVRLQPRHIEAYSSLARVVSYEVVSARAARLAVRSYRAALRVAPLHLETLHNLGEYMQAQGAPGRAVLSFERALRAGPTSGSTHLALGESLQRLCRLEESSQHYARAAMLLPRSSRAQIHALLPLTHTLRPLTHGGESARARSYEELASGGAGPARLGKAASRHALPSAADLRVHPHSSGWEASAAHILARHGVVVLPALVGMDECEELLDLIASWPALAEGTSSTTRQPYRRRHQALPLRADVSGRVATSLVHGLSAIATEALGSDALRVVECGFLTSEPGAHAQAFHADTSPAELLACESGALKVQLALVDVDAAMGPLHVIPGSHVPSSAGKGASLAVPILVGPGDVTVYHASVQHRGSANTGQQARPTFHIALVGEGPAPTGIPFTILVDDVIGTAGGLKVLGSTGVGTGAGTRTVKSRGVSTDVG